MTVSFGLHCTPKLCILGDGGGPILTDDGWWRSMNSTANCDVSECLGSSGSLPIEGACWCRVLKQMSKYIYMQIIILYVCVYINTPTVQKWWKHFNMSSEEVRQHVDTNTELAVISCPQHRINLTKFKFLALQDKELYRLLGIWNNLSTIMTL